MAKIRIEKPNSKTAHPPVWLGLILAASAAIFLVGLAAFFLRPKADLPSLEFTSLSGKVEIYDAASETWIEAKRGAFLKPGDSLRTTGEAEADFGLESLKFRVKGDTSFTYGQRGLVTPRADYRINQGELYAAEEKGFSGDLVISTPQAMVELDNGAAQVRHVMGSTSVGVMRGQARAQGAGLQGAGVSIGALEILENKDGKWEQPRRVSRDEWNRLREIYDLTVKSAAAEAEQLDLSKKAGTLFDYVFDHGTFYTPQMGYSGREFFADENSGEIFLEQEYDVFPVGSFVGMYIKTRELDLSKFSKLEFEMRQSPQQGHPQMVRIELKSKSGVVRAFAAKLPKQSWEKYSFPLHVQQPTLMTELAFVFLHDRVGESKKGAVQLRNINIVPQEKIEPAQETVPAIPPAPAPAAV